MQFRLGVLEENDIGICSLLDGPADEMTLHTNLSMKQKKNMEKSGWDCKLGTICAEFLKC